MPRHARTSAFTLSLPSINTTNTGTSPNHPQPQSHSYLHNTSYGLLEPASLSVKPTPPRPSLQHRRKSSSSSSSPVWSEKGFDFKEFKGRSVDLGEKIGDKLPGVKYSAAFLSTLRVNLALSTSLAPPSPNLLAISPGLPPSTKSLSVPPTRMSASNPTNIATSEPLANVPPLDFKLAATPKDRTDALKLVSDSVTQQRSIASTILIFHPLTLALFAAIVAILSMFLVKTVRDLPILFTTCMGILMGIMVIIQFILRPYEEMAEQINWDWLGADEMIVARFGGTVIGTCVFRIEQGSKKKSQGGSSSSGGTGGKRALIRSWTVRRRERGRGVGRGLLESLVTTCSKERGCENIEFAPVDLRAGAERVLPDWNTGGGLMNLNADFDRKEAKAEACLKDVLRDMGVGDRRRRGSR